MLRRVRIHNFKSLRHVAFDPGLTTVLVGPNASGKSNILDALRFVSEVARGSQGALQQAFANRGGVSDVAWKGAGDRTISFDLELTRLAARGGDAPQFRYRFDIAVGGPGIFQVVREDLELTYPSPIREIQLFHAESGKGAAFDEAGKKVFEAQSGYGLNVLEASVPGWIGTEVKGAFQQMRFYDLVPQAMKVARPLRGAPVLSENGDNLAEFLLVLQTDHQDEFRQLQQVMQDCFPSFGNLGVSTMVQPGGAVLSVNEKNLSEPMRVWGLANGQLAFLALMALIVAPPEMGGTLFCIEEPESHLHPWLLQQLASILFARQAELVDSGVAYPSQIIVSTHSPYVIDRVPPEALLLVSKGPSGETSIRRAPNDERINEALQDIGLGDLVFSGALGDPQ